MCLLRYTVVLLCFASLLAASTSNSLISGHNVTHRIRRMRPKPQNAENSGNFNDNSTISPESVWNVWGPAQVEYRLTRLEVQIQEKAENLRTEARDASRRLQNLEWQSAETQTSLEGFKAELGRLIQQSPLAASNNMQLEHSKIEERLENISTRIQLLVAAVRGLNSDINTLTKNVSSIVNITNSIYESQEKLVTKQFFTSGMVELKHQQLYPSIGHHSITKSDIPKSCREIQTSNIKEKSGIFRIQPPHSSKSFLVLCDFETRGGGWVVIQNRFEGAQEFYQNWHEYKHGFGNLGGEFWLGLEDIYLLTGFDVNELLIELHDMEMQQRHAYYSAFSIGPEVEGYPLKVLSGYDGDAGDSLMYHAGSRFSTKDMDQDGWLEGSCAQAHGGAWWYRGCDTSNLNGRYLNGELPEQYVYQGMYWGEFRGAQYSLLRARMLVRPRNGSSPSIFANNTGTSTKRIGPTQNVGAR